MYSILVCECSDLIAPERSRTNHTIVLQTPCGTRLGPWCRLSLGTCLLPCGFSKRSPVIPWFSPSLCAAAGFQEGEMKHQGFQNLGSAVTQHHFCCVLSIRARHGASPKYSRSGWVGSRLFCFTGGVKVMLQMGMWDERSLLPFVETTYHRRKRALKSKNKKN